MPKGPSLRDLERLQDDEVMAALQSGCHDALAVLFDRYHRLVFSIALKIVRDRGEAEDVMQNVFLDIFRSVAQFDPSRGTTRVWLLQYAYHRALTRKQYLTARSFYNEDSLEGDQAFERGPIGIASVDTLNPVELQGLLNQGLATLNSKQRRVIELAGVEGFSMQEIAEQTGDSVVNVRHHYYRGLQKLRSFIGEPSTVPHNEERTAAND